MPPREVLIPALESVLYGGMIAEGEHVYRFEKRFCEQFGLPCGLAVSSGTAALHMALLLAGVGPGDEVITTSMTAEPTNTSILQCGAIPVFADVSPQTGNLDPHDVAQLVSPRTRAVVVVHYAGYPVDLSALRAIADEHGIALIEDCAHALGARWNDRPVGTWGDFALFSFQAIKHMTTIDGGFLALRDERRVAAARRMRWFGLEKGVPRTQVDITSVGFKYNMHNVAAVIGNHQLDEINPCIEAHVRNGRFFDEALAGFPHLQPAAVPEVSRPSYWLYTLLADDSAAVERVLAAEGVVASKLHRPNHLHTVFAPYRRPLPGLEAFYRRLVHIPCGWWVSPDDARRIVAALKGM
jgi:perosamine synthetase